MRKAGVFLSLCFVVVTVWGSDNESLRACKQQGNTFELASKDGRPQVVFISREGCQFSEKFKTEVWKKVKFRTFQWIVIMNQPAVDYTEVPIDECVYQSGEDKITGTPTVLWYKDGKEVKSCRTVGVEVVAEHRFKVRMLSFLEDGKCEGVN